jgi:hypothetical protein
MFAQSIQPRFNIAGRSANRQISIGLKADLFMGGMNGAQKWLKPKLLTMLVDSVQLGG